MIPGGGVMAQGLGAATGLLGSGSGLMGGVAGGLTQDTSVGSPTFITDPNAIASKAGTSVQTGLQTGATAIDNSTKGLTTDTTTATAAGTSWFNFLGNLFSGGTGIFARVGVGVLALVFVGVGLWMVERGTEK
jgi:hypothetical protein